MYQIPDRRVPGGGFKIKVVERDTGGFIALANVCLRAADGAADGMAGLGDTELEALSDCLKWLMAALAERGAPKESDFEWSDPSEF